MSMQELRNHLEQFLAARSALGLKDRGRRSLLEDFLRYVAEVRCDGSIPVHVAVDWAVTRPKARATGLAGPSRRLSAVRGFLTYLRASNPEVTVPPVRLLAAAKGRRPYLYSADQIATLLDAALAIRRGGPLRPHTYQTLLGLMASTGVRVGEALRLKICDVELDTEPSLLHIRESKFGKSRIVPIHSTTKDRLKCYVRLRTRLGYSKRSDAFFVSERGGHINYGCLVQWFTRTVRGLNMHATDGRRTPTLHGLRHHFAIERLTLWCRQGACVQDLAPQLSVYLGHAKPERSYWYFTATPELLHIAGESFQRFSNTGVSP
jgi:integrase/recombinase XerD